MTDLQRADLEAGERGMQFNTDNSIILGVISATDTSLPPIIAGIAAQVKNIQDAESAQQHDSGNVADNKQLAKVEMARLVVKYALRGEVKAESIGNMALATSLQHPVTYITDADDVLCVTRANDMKGIMDANKGPAGVLSNIVAGDIGVMVAGIKSFTDIVNQPTNVIKQKKAQGTDKIQAFVDGLNGFIDQEKKLLHSYWDDTVNKGLSDEFDLKTHAVVLGTRHNIVEVTLVKDEDGTELTGGVVTCVMNGKTSDGGVTNVYKIVGIQSGLRVFKAEAPDRVGQSFDITVLRGKKVEVTVRMKLV